MVTAALEAPGGLDVPVNAARLCCEAPAAAGDEAHDTAGSGSAGT